MLSAGELEQMQAEVVRSLPDSCVVLRRTDVPDGAGGWVPAWATVATLPCRVRPTGAVDARESSVAGKLQGRSPFTVTLPAVYPDDDLDHAAGESVEVLESDQIRREADATALEVLGINAPESWSLGVRIFAAKVAGG